MRSSRNIGAEDIWGNPWGVGQVITCSGMCYQTSLQDMHDPAPVLPWSTGGNASLSVFSWDGADAGGAGAGGGEVRLGMGHRAGMGQEGQLRCVVSKCRCAAAKDGDERPLYH